MMRWIQVFALAPWAVASAQTSVSVNLDYAEGRYGEAEKSTTWTVPIIVKHQSGPLTLKLNLPYVRATGTAAAGGDRFAPSRQVQEGLGDPILTAAYGVIGDGDADLMVDIAVKAKIATTDRRLDLITTGQNDYSLQAELLRRIGPTTAFFTLGRTRKGDPDGVDFRDPWYYNVGLGRSIADSVTIGAFYDYRQRLTRRGAPVSEATLYAEWLPNKEYKLMVYLVRGFSDASPDRGVGATLTRRF